MSSLSWSERWINEFQVFFYELNKNVSYLSIMIAPQDQLESEQGDSHFSLSLCRLRSISQEPIFDYEFITKLSAYSLLPFSWDSQYLSELRNLRSQRWRLSCSSSGEYLIDELLSSSSESSTILPSSSEGSFYCIYAPLGDSSYLSLGILVREVLLMYFSLRLFIMCLFLLLSQVQLSKFLARLNPFHKWIRVLLTCLIQWLIHFEMRPAYSLSSLPSSSSMASISFFSLLCKYSSRSLKALSRTQRLTTEMSPSEEKSFFREVSLCPSFPFASSPKWVCCCSFFGLPWRSSLMVDMILSRSCWRRLFSFFQMMEMMELSLLSCSSSLSQPSLSMMLLSRPFSFSITLEPVSLYMWLQSCFSFTVLRLAKGQIFVLSMQLLIICCVFVSSNDLASDCLLLLLIRLMLLSARIRDSYLRIYYIQSEGSYVGILQANRYVLLMQLLLLQIDVVFEQRLLSLEAKGKLLPIYFKSFNSLDAFFYFKDDLQRRSCSSSVLLNSVLLSLVEKEEGCLLVFSVFLLFFLLIWERAVQLGAIQTVFLVSFLKECAQSVSLFLLFLGSSSLVSTLMGCLQCFISLFEFLFRIQCKKFELIIILLSPCPNPFPHCPSLRPPPSSKHYDLLHLLFSPPLPAFLPAFPTPSYDSFIVAPPLLTPFYLLPSHLSFLPFLGSLESWEQSRGSVMLRLQSTVLNSPSNTYWQRQGRDFQSKCPGTLSFYTCQITIIKFLKSTFFINEHLFTPQAPPQPSPNTSLHSLLIRHSIFQLDLVSLKQKTTQKEMYFWGDIG